MTLDINSILSIGFGHFNPPVGSEAMFGLAAKWVVRPPRGAKDQSKAEIRTYISKILVSMEYSRPLEIPNRRGEAEKMRTSTASNKSRAPRSNISKW